MDLQDLFAPVAVRNGDGNLPVEPPRPPQGRIEDIGQVGRRDDDDLPPLGEPVHQRQELGDDPLLDFAHHLLAPGGNGVDLIQKMMLGALRLPSSKIFRKCASLSP